MIAKVALAAVVMLSIGLGCANTANAKNKPYAQKWRPSFNESRLYEELSYPRSKKQITQKTRISIKGSRPGAWVQYSVNGGKTWTTVKDSSKPFHLPPGMYQPNQVKVRQLDPSGQPPPDEVRSSAEYAAEGAVAAAEVGDVMSRVSERLSQLHLRGGGAGPAMAFLSPARKAGFAGDGPVASDAMTADEELAAAALPASRRPRGGLWFQGVGGSGDLDGKGNRGSVDYDWRGMVGGVDAALFRPGLRLGVFLGGVNGSEDAANAWSENRNATAGVYGVQDMGDGWFLSGQANWTRVRISNRRRVLGQEAHADHTDRVLAFRGEISRDVPLGDGWWLEPCAGGGVTHVRLGSFHESGLTSGNESRAASTRRSGTARIGWRLAGRVDLDAGLALEPQLGLSWDIHLGPEEKATVLSVEGMPFTVTGTAADASTAVGHVGVNLVRDGGLTTYVDYTPSFSAGRREHAFDIGLRIPFE